MAYEDQVSVAPPEPSLFPTGGQVVQMPGMRAAGLGVVMAEERAKSQETQAQPLVSGLAGHIRQAWQRARDARMALVDTRLQKSIRQRRGEYDPDKLAAIRGQGGSDIYAMLTSVKCRAAASWIRDVMLAAGENRPWSIRPTPVPELPPEINEMIVRMAVAPIQQAAASGMPMDQQQVTDMMAAMRDQAKRAAFEEARKAADRMGDKMEDQLIEGGFIKALDQFIDDLVTFPIGVIKGPIVRKKPRLKWEPGGQGGKPNVVDEIVVEWERVSPFHVYPSPSSTGIDDGYLIEKHKLSRQDLQEMIGVEGYDDATIRTVLDQYGLGGLSDWLIEDVAQMAAEGRATANVMSNPDGLIDALQFWGSVPGSTLIDWGMDESEVPDSTKEYHIEAWLIGSYIIKATLNYDPLCRKPYYKASYEDVPGSFWGNSVCDLVRDPQTVVNAAARSIVNNMAMSSGPQVAINVDRLPPGEELTTLTPWRIWQVSNDPYGNSGQPVSFFQPQSNVAELMAIYEKFSDLADEYSGIPKYMQGQTTGGAGRTASGLSMMITNAGKAIKQVISNIDMDVMTPLLERLYYHNMRYTDDPELKGDVQIVAQGAAAIIAKENAQVRRNEFLATTANPIDMQIVGVEGRAAILRETAKNLDMDVDKVVPPIEVIKQKLAMQQQMMMQQQQQAAPAPGAPSSSGQQLEDGAPVTDNFSPPKGM